MTTINANINELSPGQVENKSKRKFASFIALGLAAIITANIGMSVINQMNTPIYVPEPTAIHLSVKNETYSVRQHGKFREYFDQNIIAAKPVSNLGETTNFKLRSFLPPSIHDKIFSEKYVQFSSGQKDFSFEMSPKKEGSDINKFYEYSANVKYDINNGQHADKFLKASDIKFIKNDEGKIISFTYGNNTIRRSIDDAVGAKIKEVGVEKFIKNQDAMTKEILGNINSEFSSKIGQDLVIKDLKLNVQKHDLRENMSFNVKNHIKLYGSHYDNRIVEFEGNIKMKADLSQEQVRDSFYILADKIKSDLSFHLESAVNEVLGEDHYNLKKEDLTKEYQAEIYQKIESQFKQNVEKNAGKTYKIESVNFSIKNIQKDTEFNANLKKDYLVENSPTFNVKTTDKINASIESIRISGQNRYANPTPYEIPSALKIKL